MIEVVEVSHAFGQTAALSSVSLSVLPGEVVGLVGPNGAGKTTLMRTIATLLRPDSGKVRVGGQDVVAAPARVRRLLGYLPERSRLDPELMAFEALEFFAEIAGHRGDGHRRRVSAALESSGLERRARCLVRELSKGQEKRLALEAALMGDPSVLLLDEPTDGLDPAVREEYLTEIRSVADRGTAVLLASHVLPELERIADRTLFLLSGRIRTPDDAATSHRYRLRVRDDVEGAHVLASEHADVKRALVDESGCLCVSLREGATDPADLVRSLAVAGVAIVGLETMGQDLRSRFLRAVHDAGPRASERGLPRS